jgi:hypothetical protein
VVVSGTSTAPRKPPRRNVSVSPVRGASGGGSAGDLLLLCKINEIELHFEFINVKIIMCPLSQRYLRVVYKRCRQFGGGRIAFC